MNKTFSILFTALLLGLAWAIRGDFGHEWGAAWAGAVGGLAIIVAMKRKDWRKHAPSLALLSALGWGTGGMMSYGIVIGYCKGIDFWNVGYGYTMLALIGGLYGCIGGGLLGLGLASSPEKRPQWAALFAEMVAAAWLSWGFLIYQMELFMTPPRSELWAACLGAAGALLWYLYRNGFHNAFRVALYTALGAGFGFSFGNFIQTLGIASGISYNWWNVMEFTLGFCGGGAMAYAIHTSLWPNKGKASLNNNLAALLVLFFFIPLTNYASAFSEKKITQLAERLSITDVEALVGHQQGVALFLIFAFSALILFLWVRGHKQKNILSEKADVMVLLGLSLFYLLFDFLQQGLFFEAPGLSSTKATYIPIYLIALGIWFYTKNKEPSRLQASQKESLRTGFLIFGALLLVIIVISFISIQSHAGIPGYHERF